MEVYNKEQIRKTEILQTQLAEYNDGRRKTVYCVAVNLLPLPQIEKIMDQVANTPSLHVLTLKDKAAYVVALFEDVATQSGLILKLRKKSAA